MQVNFYGPQIPSALRRESFVTATVCRLQACRPRGWRNQEGQIMPATLLLAPPDFQTFLRPWASGCQLDDCKFQSGINFKNLKGQVVEMCNRQVCLLLSVRIVSYYFGGSKLVKFLAKIEHTTVIWMVQQCPKNHCSVKKDFSSAESV